ncbi:hypothetical protein [Clostridium cadaveris]|uniref:hypothetical protein n=1 Tax=Clostridium cadaveris TaxID=1529 RepID=UPI0015B6868B|nr:hypothetical protein [Clostridium cadaveris]NWK10830.1 hypothetical protein [Clostridium cadaveris]
MLDINLAPSGIANLAATAASVNNGAIFVPIKSPKSTKYCKASPVFSLIMAFN